MDDFGFDDAMLMGAGYAMYRHGQDKQTAAVLEALEGITAQPQSTAVLVDDESIDRRGQHPIPNAVEHSDLVVPESWADFIGQEKLKRQLLVHIAYAQETFTRLPHVLLASGMPGVGKTTLSRMIAQAMEVNIIELVPPFNIYTLVEAAMELLDGDILFIDEIHALAQNGKKGAEILLKVLEDGTAYLPNGEVVDLPDITVIGATTDRDMLPEPVVDRFKIKPHFDAYSSEEMQLITLNMAARHDALDLVTANEFDLCAWIGQASRGTPRIVEEFVLALRALSVACGGSQPSAGELFDFMDVQPDGLARAHVDYLVTLYTRFERPIADSQRVEYVAGEATMQSVLRETKQGMARIERYLMEMGFIERTPKGRALTPAGVARAAFLAENPTPSASIYTEEA